MYRLVFGRKRRRQVVFIASRTRLRYDSRMSDSILLSKLWPYPLTYVALQRSGQCKWLDVQYFVVSVRIFLPIQIHVSN